MPNPNLEIKHLFTYNRFSNKYEKILYTILYLPVGLILLILRSILALSILLISLILPETAFVQKIINKITCLILGVTVNIENPSEVENVKVYISNSLSIFDHLSVFTAVDAVSPGPELNAYFTKAIGIHHFGNSSNMVNFRKSILSYILEKDNSVCFFPEGRCTNGRALLKFKTYPFSISDVIQPIVIQIKRPFLDISVTNFGASYWSDVFFYMFSPVTIYNLKFLPVQIKGQSTDEDFSENVRQLLAQKINVPLSNFTAMEVMEWEKRKITEQQRARMIPEPNRSLKLQALQVKEVLPHVPLNVIYDDLSRTRNVDSTISNILEGHISFVPEPIRNLPNRNAPSTSSSTSQSSSMSAGPVSPGSLSTFPKTAQDRLKSFQERKAQLIATARRRYIEKHNLDIPI